MPAFSPLSAPELPAPTPIPWIWSHYLAQGYITMLVGLWKAGKSTLLAHLIRSMTATHPGYLGTEVTAANRVLVISEEAVSLWSRRLALLNHHPPHLFINAHTPQCYYHNEWEDLIRDIATFTTENDIHCIIMDTIANIWPVADENDAAKVREVIMPLQLLAKTGAAVLLVHHTSKADRTQGRVARGSGAFAAGVDVIVEFRRQSTDPGDRRRRLTAYSRISEAPPEMLIEYTPDGTQYLTIGTPHDAELAANEHVVRDFLISIGEPQTPQQVKECILPSMGIMGVRELLKEGARRGVWSESGTGVRGNPLIYFPLEEESVPTETLTVESEIVIGSEL